jgi:alpha-mannosidase
LPDWTQDGLSLRNGDSWSSVGKEVRLVSGPIQVPDAWPIDETRLLLSLGGEGCVTLRQDGRESVRRIDWHHKSIRVESRHLDAVVRARPRGRFGHHQYDPRFRASLVWVDLDVTALRLLLLVVAEAAAAIADRDAVEELLCAAEVAVRRIDWPTGTREFVSRAATGDRLGSLGPLPIEILAERPTFRSADRDSLVSTRGRLLEDLDQLRTHYPKRGAFALLGHVHIDLAWLWTMSETELKVESSLAEACHLLGRYPEYQFVQSSAQFYDYAEHAAPEIFDQVAALVRSGRWHPVGGMWIEPDVILSTGEGLVRQLVHGQRYFREKFGVKCEIGWLPDTFGFPSCLPQLLLGAGIRTFFTTKLKMNDTTEFPHDVFWWEGRDGSRILTVMSHGPRGYNVTVDPGVIVRSWDSYEARRRHREGVLCLGYGSGTSPDEEMLDRVELVNRLPHVPALRFREAGEYFDQIGSEARELGDSVPTWVGGLYLEAHRGTYTAQGRTKSLYRRAVSRLLALEALLAVARMQGQAVRAALGPLWRVVLRAEFHDVLPGTSINEVHADAERELSRVLDEVESLLASSLAAIVGRGPGAAVAVFNPSAQARALRWTADRPFPNAQAVGEGWLYANRAKMVAPLACITYVPARSAGGVTATDHQLENEILVVTLDDDGHLVSVWDKQEHREVLTGTANMLTAYKDQSADWDAWELGQDHRRVGEVIGSVTAWEVVETGPHRAAVRITRRFRNSTIVQDIRLWAESRRIDFATRFDWHDRTWLVRAAFPVAVRAGFASLESAFGIDQYPTRSNTAFDQARYEVPGHRFCDVSQPDYGVALLNDGRYGYSVDGGTIGLSLLRSPIYPDPLADEGESTVRYALLPHRGALAGSEVLAEADELSNPLVVSVGDFPVDKDVRSLSFGGLPLSLSALKPSDDGDSVILRMYEPAGRCGVARVGPTPGWSITAETDLLEEKTGSPSMDFTPFAIRTWRLERG